VDFDAVAPGASEVIMVSSRPDGAAAGGEMVYKIPLIDVEHIADEDLPLFDENYNSAGGCELILRAKAKYEASQIEEDEELGYEGLKAINRLGEWSPTEYESVPKPEFTSHVDKDVTEDIAGVIVEHEKVMESNAAHISTIMQALPVVGTEAVDHLSPKVDEVVVKLNSLHVDFDIMLEEVGRKSEIATLTDRGFNSLAAAIHHLLDNNDPTLVVNKLSSIETLVSDMDEDVSKRILGAAGSVLEKMNNHVNALENRIKILEEKPPAVVSPSPTGPVSRIPQSAVITLDDGTTVMSVGELGAKLKTLQKQSSILQEAFEAQGGVTYNGTNYTSEKELEQVVARDMPGGAHFNVFVNPVDVFSHHKEARRWIIPQLPRGRCYCLKGVNPVSTVLSSSPSLVPISRVTTTRLLRSYQEN